MELKDIIHLVENHINSLCNKNVKFIVRTTYDDNLKFPTYKTFTIEVNVLCNKKTILLFHSNKVHQISSAIKASVEEQMKMFWNIDETELVNTIIKWVNTPEMYKFIEEI